MSSGLSKSVSEILAECAIYLFAVAVVVSDCPLYASDAAGADVGVAGGFFQSV